MRKPRQYVGVSASLKSMRKKIRTKVRHIQVEEQLRLVVEASPNAMLLVNPEGHIHLVNRQTEALFGYSRTELLGYPVEMLVPRQLCASHKDERDAFFAAPTARPMGTGRDLFGLRKDGSLVSVEISLNPIITPVSRFILASIIDITERKRAEEALRLSEERFAKAFRASPDGIVISRVSDGRIIEVNDRWCSLFGYSRTEALGRTSLDLNIYANPADRQLFLNQLETQGFVRDLELPLQGNSDQVRQMTVSGERLIIAGELCILSFIRDITQRKRTEEKLKETLAELTRSNAELEQFAYVASHDLQEPLRMVSSYTQLLARRYKGKLDADAEEFIAFAVEGASRMKRLLDDLLAYSRVNTRRKPPQATSSDTILAHTLANLEVAIDETQAVITYDPLPTVLADETQLMQLFQNLIGNALKFRTEAPPQVHISAQPRDREWLFSVRDNGIGLDPKFAEHIFVIFQRLHTRGEYPGTGIGLAICKRIVERHGGRIWVESQPGQGATFYFTLPGAKAAERYSVSS